MQSYLYKNLFLFTILTMTLQLLSCSGGGGGGSGSGSSSGSNSNSGSVGITSSQKCSDDLNENKVPVSCPCPPTQIYNTLTGFCINTDGSTVTDKQCSPNQTYDSDHHICVDNDPVSFLASSNIPTDKPYNCSSVKNFYGKAENCSCPNNLFYDSTKGVCQNSKLFENNFETAELILTPNSIEKKLIGEFYYYSFRLNIDKKVTIKLGFNYSDYEGDLNFTLFDERKVSQSFQVLDRKDKSIEVLARPGLYYL